jgi:hypothetical protein
VNDDLLTRVDHVLASELTIDDVAPGSVEALALLLQAAAPEPSDAFVDRLDRQLASRWLRPEPTISGRITSLVRRRRVASGMLATAACIAIAAVTLSSLDTSGTSQDQRSGGKTDLFALTPRDYVTTDQDGTFDAEQHVSSSGGTSSTTAVSATVTDYRRYLLGSGLFLEVEPRDVPDVIADAVKLADELGGYAGSSSYDVEKSKASGSVDVWVPAAAYTEAVAKLSKLGTVERIVEHKRDKTAPRNTQVRELGEYRDMLRRLEANVKQAPSDYGTQQVEALERQVAQREQALRNLDKRISMALISVKVDGVHHPRTYERWTVDWAWHEARQLLERIGALAILVLAVVFLPLLIVVPAVLLLRRRNRRARERLLDE